jgi:hypothetical protein
MLHAAHVLSRPLHRLASGSKNVTVLAAALLAALWARQQRLAKSQRPDSLLGRLGSAVSARLQARTLFKEHHTRGNQN